MKPNSETVPTGVCNSCDVVLLGVEQAGGIACHTGRRSCFFQKLDNGRWVTVEPVIKDPKEIYGR